MILRLQFAYYLNLIQFYIHIHYYIACILFGRNFKFSKSSSHSCSVAVLPVLMSIYLYETYDRHHSDCESEFHFPSLRWWLTWRLPKPLQFSSLISNYFYFSICFYDSSNLFTRNRAQWQYEHKRGSLNVCLHVWFTRLEFWSISINIWHVEQRCSYWYCAVVHRMQLLETSLNYDVDYRINQERGSERLKFELSEFILGRFRAVCQRSVVFFSSWICWAKELWVTNNCVDQNTFGGA